MLRCLKQISKRLFIGGGLIVSQFLLGCVSVDQILIPPVPKKAEGLQFTSPSSYPKSDFKEVKNSTVDLAWQNTKNGNTIAYLSECNPKTDPSLKAMEAENLAALTNVEIVETNDTNYNEREALISTVNGQVDGVEVRIRQVIFKKNGCNFTLSYVGRRKFFDKDEKTFKLFVEGFKAP